MAQTLALELSTPPIPAPSPGEAKEPKKISWLALLQGLWELTPHGGLGRVLRSRVLQVGRLRGYPCERSCTVYSGASTANEKLRSSVVPSTKKTRMQRIGPRAGQGESWIPLLCRNTLKLVASLHLHLSQFDCWLVES